MKTMTFKIEIEDFWLDEEHELEPALKNYIISDVVSQIAKSIEKKIDDTITRVVKEQVSASLYRDIQKIVKETVETGMVNRASSYNDKERVTIKDYILHDFEANAGYRSPKDQIEKLAKQFADELKNRYDLLFASQIVSKLNTNGFFRPDVAKILLESNGDNPSTKKA